MAEWKKRIPAEECRGLLAELNAVIPQPGPGRRRSNKAMARLRSLSGLPKGALQSFLNGNGTSLPTFQKIRAALKVIATEPVAEPPSPPPSPGSKAQVDAHQLRSALRAHGLTQAGFAERAGLPKQTLVTLLSRKGRTTVGTKEKIDRALAELTGPSPQAAIVQRQLPFPDAAGGRATRLDVTARFTSHPAEPPTADTTTLVQSFLAEPAFQALGLRAIEILLTLAKSTTNKTEGE